MQSRYGRAPELTILPSAPGGPRRRTGNYGGLFRQQQRGRLPDVELGALQSGGRAGGGVSAARREAALVPRSGRNRGPRRRTQLRGDSGAAARQRGGTDPY